MTELEISAITARAHAKQLRWLLERCREEKDPDKAAILEIEKTICEAEHLADFSDKHASCCVQCQHGAEPQPNRRSWANRSSGRRWLRFEEAWQLLHVVDESLIAIAPPWIVRSRAPQIVIQAKRWLGPEDPRLREVDTLVASPDRHQVELGGPVSQVERYAWQACCTRSTTRGTILTPALARFVI